MRADTVAERLKILLQGTDANGKRWNATSLARAAGLKSRTHIGGIMRGEQGDQITPTTARKIAQATGVSVNWLLYGEGAAPIGARTDDEVYPSLTRFLVFARARGLDAVVLDALRLERHKKGDPGAAYWPVRYKELAREKHEVDAISADDLE